MRQKQIEVIVMVILGCVEAAGDTGMCGSGRTGRGSVTLSKREDDQSRRGREGRGGVSPEYRLFLVRRCIQGGDERWSRSSSSSEMRGFNKQP